MIQSATVLIIDDQPDNLQTIEDIFAQANLSYRIMKSPEGNTALRVIEKVIPDLIITDWNMPEMDGIELIRHLKNNPDARDIPVIICTGIMTSPEDLQTALSAGATDYIRKPVDPIELIARSRSMLELAAAYKKIKRQNKILQENLEIMSQMAHIDPLTQLPNRRDFFEKIAYEKASADRNSETFALALGDIDNFKWVNDTHGHACGDFVLTEVARSLRAIVRKQDYVGRWGGEEFLFLFPRTNLQGGHDIAEKIRWKIANHSYRYHDISLNITLTLGVCAYDSSAPIDQHLKWADEALYEGKRTGRNRVVLFQH